MSLILEALRKSENERQRGRAPGLFVEQQPLRRQRTQVPAWAFAVAAATLLAVLAAWAWREFGDDEGVASGMATAAVPTSVATDSATPVRDALPPAETRPPAGAVPSTTPPAADPASIGIAPAASPDPVATVDTAAAPAMAALPAPEATSAAPVAATPAVPQPAATAPDVPDAIVVPSVAADPAEPPADPAVPGLASLSAGERAALPPLKLSMHVYSDDPARRFVIVDGARLVEGASPAPGIVVAAIRRDGAVLDIQGRPVLLSRP